jgi:hypothetical protein
MRVCFWFDCKADGLKEDAIAKEQESFVKSDLTTEIVNVNLEKALEGDLEADCFE